MTSLQFAIIATIRRIPSGRAASYGEVARAAGNARAARAVVGVLKTLGAALPWHRVVSSGGRIGLPGHAGIEQRFLLEQEGVRFRGRAVHPDYLFVFKQKAMRVGSNDARNGES